METILLKQVVMQNQHIGWPPKDKFKQRKRIHANLVRTQTKQHFLNSKVKVTFWLKADYRYDDSP